MRTKLTIALASSVITKPITAYRMVSLAVAAFLESPAEREYIIPPTIIIMTAIIPAKVRRVLVILGIISPTLLGVPASPLIVILPDADPAAELAADPAEDPAFDAEDPTPPNAPCANATLGVIISTAKPGGNCKSRPIKDL